MSYFPTTADSGSGQPATGALQAADQARLQTVLAEAQRRGFLGPGPVTPHITHSLGFLAGTDLIGNGDTTGLEALDLGSGGGLPGLVLALVRPEWRWTLLEGSTRRADFLADVAGELGLDRNVVVLAARAEDAGRGPLRGSKDLVVARAFGPPPVTAECAAPFLRLGGLLVTSGPPSPSPLRWPTSGISTVGLAQVVHLVSPISLDVLELVVACPKPYPRHVGVPTRRPLW